MNLEAEAIESDVILSPSDRIRFAWWNTSLSPSGKSRATEEERKVARSIVKTLIDDLRVDFLALGEVTELDLFDLKDGCLRESLGVYNGTGKDGRLQFDTGAIYCKSRFQIFDEISIISQRGNNRFKTANRITLITEPQQTPIHVFVSHWPSRGVTEENISTRKILAGELRNKVNELEAVSGNPMPPIILMGDFNDEPFDESLADLLFATRDRNLASSSSGFLYNPFWRHLGEKDPYFLGSDTKSNGGSYYHKSGRQTKWRTFDQILFSAAFLGNSDWHLNEKATMILELEAYSELIMDSKSVFDHFPVLGTIEKSTS